MDNVFDYIIILFSVLIALIIVSIIVKGIAKHGFRCGDTFILILILFYIIVPSIYLLFPDKTDNTTLFNRVLANNSFSDFSSCMLLCSLLLLLAWAFYKNKAKYRFSFRPTNKVRPKYNTAPNLDWAQVNKSCKRKIQLWTDILMAIGMISVLGCIFAVGGFKNYLALGSRTRGLNKNVTDYISSAFLPLITLSSVILAPPFLYKYLLDSSEGGKILKIKFYVSFVIAVVYLVYNQGRLPVLLFFAPFLLNSKLARKMKIISLIAAAVFCVFLLEPLADLFTYLSYGRINNAQIDFTATLLQDFTYPFTNILNRRTLTETAGFRYGLDYVAWPMLVLPSFILRIFGASKTGFVTLQLLNTGAYESIVGLRSGGGIPADFITFNYYQFGWLSVILMLYLSSRFLNAVDSRILYVKYNKGCNILSLRLSILLVSLVNNFDFSVLIKMRLDFIIITIVLFYISRKGKQCENNMALAESEQG